MLWCNTDILTITASITGALKDTLIVDDHWKMILQGLWATIVISVLSIICGTLLGYGIYSLTKSRRDWVRKFAQWYRVIVRGTPMMVLLFLIFYTILRGHYGILAAVIAFSINFSNFACSVIQSSNDSVGAGLIDAGRALGMTNMQVFRYVVAPQALHNAMPAYKFQVVSLIKSTSVVGYVAIQDLTRTIDTIRLSTGETLLPLLIATSIYFLLAWLIVKLLDSIVKKVNRT